MTDQTKMTDELIMAYADGELPEAEAKKVELAAAANEDIRKRIELFKETARQLKTAAADLPPVPDALAARISAVLDEDARKSEAPADSNVIPFAPRNWVRQWPAALAASITLAVGLAAGIAIAPNGMPQDAPPFGITALADPGIATALSSLESGSSTMLTSDATLNVIASFVDADGTLCREFDYEAADGPSIVSVACRSGDAWHPKIAITATSGQSSDYAPASSMDALEAWLTSSGLGDPLDAQDEKQRLDQLKPLS